MNKKILKSLVSIFVATLMLTSSFAALADDGIITPWNTTYNFNGNTSGVTWDGTSTSEGYKWPTTYGFLIGYPNAPIEITDSTNGVLDSVTKTKGDKYMRLRSLRTETDSETGEVTTYNRDGITGIMQFNFFSDTNAKRVNGGLSTGIVSYEVDLRVDEIRGAIYKDDKGTAGRLYFNTYNSTTGSTTTLLTILMLHGPGGSWYISYPLANGTLKSPQGFTEGDWIRFKVVINVPDGTYTLSATPVSKVSGSTSRAWTVGPIELAESKKGIPASTHIAVRTPCTCTTSIDNFSVTKETFVVDETKTSIADDGTNVNASVTIGNCVYADPDTQYGDAVQTTSPVAILALYNKADGSLIDVDFDTVTYENHNPSSDTDKNTYFKAAPDYQTVSLSLAQPSVEYEAKVYVWDSMSGMVPYVETYPTVAAE